MSSGLKTYNLLYSISADGSKIYTFCLCWIQTPYKDKVYDNSSSLRSPPIIETNQQSAPTLLQQQFNYSWNELLIAAEEEELTGWWWLGWSILFHWWVIGGSPPICRSPFIPLFFSKSFIHFLCLPSFLCCNARRETSSPINFSYSNQFVFGSACLLLQLVAGLLRKRARKRNETKAGMVWWNVFFRGRGPAAITHNLFHFHWAAWTNQKFSFLSTFDFFIAFHWNESSLWKRKWMNKYYNSTCVHPLLHRSLLKIYKIFNFFQNL